MTLPLQGLENLKPDDKVNLESFIGLIDTYVVHLTGKAMFNPNYEFLNLRVTLPRGATGRDEDRFTTLLLVSSAYDYGMDVKELTRLPDGYNPDNFSPIGRRFSVNYHGTSFDINTVTGPIFPYSYKPGAYVQLA